MNLIVTCWRHYEQEAADEIRRILGESGDGQARTERSVLSGIVMVDTSADPVRIPRIIRERIRDEPWSVRYVRRAIPIQSWIETDMDRIVSEAARLAGAIRDGQTYRVTVKKRNSDVSSMQIIERIADTIQREVSLESPDRIVRVEIFGEHTGVSVLEPDGVLSVDREKRAASE